MENNLNLHQASRQGDEARVRQLLLSGTDPNCLDQDQWTALHWAALEGHEKVGRLLLFAGASPDGHSASHSTPLHEAAAAGHQAMVRILLVAGANCDTQQTSSLETPLHWAAHNGHVNIVDILLKAQANCNLREKSGQTPLWDSFFLSSQEKGLEITRLLVKAGADIDHQDDEGTTLLIRSSRCGHVDVVNWCISQGADINLQDDEGQSALHHAAETFSAEGVADFLIQAGANLEIRDQRGYSPLDLAAKEGSVEVARLLIQAGSDYNAYGKHGLTPLHIAAQTGAVEIVSLLIQAGADCNARSRMNSNSRYFSLIGYIPQQTPLHTACDRSLDEEIYEWSQDEEQRICQVVAQLISGGADIDARDGSQWTSLHLAASSSLTNVAMFLIESGADFALFTSSGRGPLDIAVQKKLDDLVDYIISKQDDADRKEELRRRKPSNTLDDSW